MMPTPGSTPNPAAGHAAAFGAFAGLDVVVIPGTSPLRQQWETAALQAGIPLALPHRISWDPVAQAQQSWLIVAKTQQGEARAACVARAFPSRALPFHRVLRVERLTAPAGAPVAAVLWGVRALSQRVSRVIRVHVELFDPMGSGLDEAVAAAEAVGFERWNTPRIYGRTVTLDLRADEDVIFSGLHATGRRHVRAVERHPVEVRAIEAGFPPGVLDALLRETLDRTGGVPPSHPWARILELSEQHPELSRVVGLFRTDLAGPGSLLSFAWGCHHGDHAHYATAASTRRTDLRLPMMYPLAWDMILWARRHGATTFDFGGITAGRAGGEDRLGGISDFKRRFTDRVVEAGAECVFEPSPRRARAAVLASSLVQRVLRRSAS